MIVRSKILYEEVSNKHSLPVELVESIGNCVFERLRKKLDAPTELAYELPKFGIFVIRFKMFKQYYTSFVKQLNRGDLEAIIKRDANPELFARNTLLYNKMLNFKQKRAEKRKERYDEGKDNPE